MSVTVVTPVSPVKSHPDISIITETLESVRFHLPDSEIVLLFDGVRPEQEGRRADYEEATRRTLWWADKVLGGVCPFVFDGHLHQVGMLRKVIDEIRTPLMLFCEQDTPLETDPIDWDACINLIQDGEADVVRFSHESEVLAAHSHMSVPGSPEGFHRTCQWSQRPHLASVAYYRRILASHFSPDACCFIEDVMHSVCHEAYKLDGINGWLQHKLAYFHPEGNIRRSRHIDGRAGEEKYESAQRF